MYKIRAKYFYYSTSYNAPKNGVLRDNHSKQVMEFETRNEAIDYLCNGYAYNCERDSDGAYSNKGEYVTNSGEYARPSYKIVTSRA